MGEFIGILIGAVICVLIFLALRQVVLWYWKVEDIIKNQELTNKLLSNNNALLNEQILIMKRQNNVPLTDEVKLP